MKRTVHARLVGIGRESPEFVDKTNTPGIVYTRRDLIDAQLRGVPLKYGEMYGKEVAPDGLSRRSRMKGQDK